MDILAVILGIFLLFWYICFFIQLILSYGTAYRFTKRGGDNGVVLWGWMLALSFASLIPGLGFYLWHKNKEVRNSSQYQQPQNQQPQNRFSQPYSSNYQVSNQDQATQGSLMCPNCARTITGSIADCPYCGYKFSY